jgi:hypothetical protein
MPSVIFTETKKIMSTPVKGAVRAKFARKRAHHFSFGHLDFSKLPCLLPGRYYATLKDSPTTAFTIP